MATDLDNLQSILASDRMEVSGGTPSQTKTVYYTSITGTSATQSYVHTDVNARWVIYSTSGTFLETGMGSVTLIDALHRWNLPNAAVVSQF